MIKMVSLFPPRFPSKSQSASCQSSSVGSTNCSTSGTTRRTKNMPLPQDFVPSKYSVLCGRGKKYSDSPGNRYLKSLVNMSLQQYSDAKTKVEKSCIVSSIMTRIKELTSWEGAFIKPEDGLWWQVDDSFAREKIGGWFRDCLHTRYRSSAKSKHARKKAAMEPHFGENDSTAGSDGGSNHPQLSDYAVLLAEEIFSPSKSDNGEEAVSCPSHDGKCKTRHRGQEWPTWLLRLEKKHEDCIVSLLPRTGMSEDHQGTTTRQGRPLRSDIIRECMPFGLPNSNIGLNTIFATLPEAHKVLGDALVVDDLSHDISGIFWRRAL
jgi:hypothetical protein